MQQRDDLPIWEQRLRHARRFTTASLGIGAMIMLVAGLATMDAVARPASMVGAGARPSPWAHSLVLLCGAVLLAAVAAWRWHRCDRLIRVLRASGGQLCPICLRTVVAGPAPGEDTCPRCKRGYHAGTLRRWWDDWLSCNGGPPPLPVTDPRGAEFVAPWLRLQQAGYEGLDAPDTGNSAPATLEREANTAIDAVYDQSLRARLLRMAKWTAGSAAMVVALAQVADPRVTQDLMQFATTALAFMLLYALLTFALRWYPSLQRRCARCHYGCGSELARIDRCPECGLDWRQLGSTRRGHTRWRRRGVIPLVGAIIAAVLVLPLLWRSADTAATALTPNHRLVRSVQYPSGLAPIVGNNQRWETLAWRDLTPAQVDEVAEAVVAALERGWTVHQWAEYWLISHIQAGIPSEAIVSRYLRLIFEPRIIGPELVAEGAPTTWRIALVQTPRFYPALEFADVGMRVQGVSIETAVPHTVLWTPPPGAYARLHDNRVREALVRPIHPAMHFAAQFSLPPVDSDGEREQAATAVVVIDLEFVVREVTSDPDVESNGNQDMANEGETVFDLWTSRQTFRFPIRIMPSAVLNAPSGSSAACVTWDELQAAAANLETSGEPGDAATTAAPIEHDGVENADVAPASSNEP